MEYIYIYIHITAHEVPPLKKLPSQDPFLIVNLSRFGFIHPKGDVHLDGLVGIPAGPGQDLRIRGGVELRAVDDNGEKPALHVLPIRPHEHTRNIRKHIHMHVLIGSFIKFAGLSLSFIAKGASRRN